MLHNPVILPDDIERFAEIVRRRELNERLKVIDRSKLRGRIQLFQEIIAAGLDALLREGNQTAQWEDQRGSTNLSRRE